MRLLAILASLGGTRLIYSETNIFLRTGARKLNQSLRKILLSKSDNFDITIRFKNNLCIVIGLSRRIKFALSIVVESDEKSISSRNNKNILTSLLI